MEDFISIFNGQHYYKYSFSTDIVLPLSNTDKQGSFVGHLRDYQEVFIACMKSGLPIEGDLMKRITAISKTIALRSYDKRIEVVTFEGPWVTEAQVGASFNRWEQTNDHAIFKVNLKEMLQTLDISMN